MAVDEDELIESAQKGDRDAFGALVKEHQKRAYATAFHLMRNHHDADDVTQEALVRAFRGLARFDRRAAFSTWLHRIVVNTGINALRKRKREPTLMDTNQQLGNQIGEDPRLSAESRELARAVLHALAKLSETLRTTLVLTAVEGMTYKEVARALDVPEGTVAWRVNQARQELAERLAPLVKEKSNGIADELLRRAANAASAT